MRILAGMLTFKRLTTLDFKPSFAAYVLATSIHYAIGVLFAFVYHWLIIRVLFQTTFANSILFGAVIGTAGIAGWSIFFAIHPGPPPVRLPTYLSVIWVGHIILSVVMVYVFRFFVETSSAAIPTCYMINKMHTFLLLI